MKKYIITFLVISGILILSISAKLDSSGSPGAKTGSPGDNNTTCTQCHSGTANSVTGWITSTIPANGYTPGTTYSITVTGTHTGVVKFGFECTAETSSGSKTGTFSITNSTETKLTNSNHAVTHKSAGTTPTNNSKSWSFNWTAPAAGTGNVTFYAAFNAANGNNSTSGDVIYKSSLTVSEISINTPPVFTSSPVLSATAGINYVYDIVCTDVDAGNTLTLNAVTVPAWLTLTSTGNGTATLSGIPTTSDVGSNPIVLTVTDGLSSEVTQSFNIDVTNPNTAPVFNSSPINTAVGGQLYQYDIVCSDIDAGTTLIINCTLLPAWLTFTDNGNGTATLTGTPSNADAGTHNVTLTVSDGLATSEQSFPIEVTSSQNIDNVIISDKDVNVLIDESFINVFINSLNYLNPEVNLYNAEGKKIICETKNISDKTVKINHTALKTGVYIVEVVSGNNTYSAKVFVK